MYYFAIFVALLSTFVNSSAQLQHDKTSAALEPSTSPCKTRYKDQHGSQQSKSSDSTEELSDAILHELALQKALSAASSVDRSKIRIKQQDRDSDALANIRDVLQQTRSASDAMMPNELEASQVQQTDKIKEEIINEIPLRQHRVNKKDDSNKEVNNGVKNAVENFTNGTKQDNGKSNDIGKNSKDVSQSEALIPAARLFEDLELSENVNSNKNVNSKKKPKYRSFPNVEPSADVKYNPRPYVKNRMNGFDNGNDNVNINSNRNEMSMENEERIQNRRRKRVEGNENLSDGTNSDGIETKLLSKPIESATQSGIEDSIKIKDIQEMKKALSTNDSFEVVALSTTPSVKYVDSIPGSNGSRVKRRRKHRRGKDRSRGSRKKHEKKDQHDQQSSTKQRKNHYLPVVSMMESHSKESEVSTVDNAPVSTESSASLGLKAFEAFRREIMTNKNLTDTILKLLIDTEEVSALKKQRLKRLLDQLNVDEKKTILYDLEKEMKPTLDENTTVKPVVISEAEPKIFVGLLARPSQGFQSPDTKDVKMIELLSQKSETPSTLETLGVLEPLGSPSVNTPRNPNDAEQSIEEISKKAIREKSDRSQELTESSSTKLTTDSEAKTKETVKNNAEVEEKTLTDRLTSDKVISILDDPKVKTIYEKALNELRKQKSHEDSNVNLNTNDNKNQLSDQTRHPLNISKVGLLLDRPVPHPRPGLDPQLDVTKLIEVNLIPSNEDKEFKSRARIHGRYSGILKEDDDARIKKAAESHRPETIRNLKKINKRPLSPPIDSDSVSQDENLNVNSNLNVNTNDDDTESDIEFTRRAAKIRIPHHSNRNRNRNVNRNVNVNTNVNNIQAPASEDYYVDGDVWSSRRALDRTISYDGNSNSNSNVNSNMNDNQNVVDSLVHRKVPHRELRKDEVKISQETVDSILREVSQLRKQLAEKEAATNLDRKRLWQNVDRKYSFDQSPNDRVFLEY